MINKYVRAIGAYDYPRRSDFETQHYLGSVVAEKRVDFTFNPNGQFNTIARYADLLASELVATGTYGYNAAGRLTSLVYTQGSTTLVSHGWTYDAADEITQYVNSLDGTANYSYDPTGQLVGADYDYQDGETYQFDSNGNRVNDDYTVGDNNQMAAGAGYKYLYDADGNREYRFVSADGDLNAGDTDITKYTWDNRNRLTGVTHFDTYSHFQSGLSDQSVEYKYDYQNRLIHKTLDPDGSSSNIEAIHQTAFVYDGNEIIEQFDKTGSGSLSSSNLSHRYLYGPAVDQILADEAVSSLTTSGQVRWTLADNLGTVRDLASYNSGTHATTIANHRVYEAFGTLTSQTNAAVDCLFGYTGKPLDKDTGEQYNINRWYDSIVAGWLCQDPIGFASGTTNLYCYCGNSPTNWIDPLGLWTLDFGFTINISIPLFSLSFNLSGGVVVDNWGNAGGYLTGGGGRGIGTPSFIVGIHGGGSNALTLDDLNGPFGAGNAILGIGPAVSVDIYGGRSKDGPVLGGDLTAGYGYGVGMSYGATTTGIWKCKEGKGPNRDALNALKGDENATRRKHNLPPLP